MADHAAFTRLNWAIAFQRLRLVLYAFLVVVAESFEWTERPRFTPAIEECAAIARSGDARWIFHEAYRYDSMELCRMLAFAPAEPPRKPSEWWRDAPVVIDANKPAAKGVTTTGPWDVVSTEPYRPGPSESLSADPMPPNALIEPRAGDLLKRSRSESLVWAQARHVVKVFGWAIVVATILELLAQLFLWVLGGLWATKRPS